MAIYLRVLHIHSLSSWFPDCVHELLELMSTSPLSLNPLCINLPSYEFCDLIVVQSSSFTTVICILRQNSLTFLLVSKFTPTHIYLCEVPPFCHLADKIMSRTISSYYCCWWYKKNCMSVVFSISW